MITLKEFLQNNDVCYWELYNEIEPGLNLNSNLQEVVKFFLKILDIQRDEFGPIEFFFEESKYDESNLNQTLADIGIESGYLIIVEFTTYPRFSNQPCTRKNLNPHIKYKDGIKFELSLRDKLTFCLEKCLAKTTKTGTSYVEILKYVLTRTDRPIEINTIQEKIDEMTNLTHSYLSGIQNILRKLFIL